MNRGAIVAPNNTKVELVGNGIYSSRIGYRWKPQRPGVALIMWLSIWLPGFYDHWLTDDERAMRQHFIAAIDALSINRLPSAIQTGD